MYAMNRSNETLKTFVREWQAALKTFKAYQQKFLYLRNNALGEDKPPFPVTINDDKFKKKYYLLNLNAAGIKKFVQNYWQSISNSCMSVISRRRCRFVGLGFYYFYVFRLLFLLFIFGACESIASVC